MNSKDRYYLLGGLQTSFRILSVLSKKCSFATLVNITQSAFTRSKLKIETLEQGVEYVQS